MRARLAALTAVLVAGGAMIAVPEAALAATAPQLACGSTVMTSCTDTAHFSDVAEWLTPLGSGVRCPGYVADDYGLMIGTGNGIEHQNINRAGDFWATNTFTGNVTITFYDPENVDVTVIDDNGDVIATPTGPADNVVSGHITEWFGVSDNKQAGTFGVTTSFLGTDASGIPVSIHINSHQNWTPGSGGIFAGPPHHAKISVSC